MLVLQKLFDHHCGACCLAAAARAEELLVNPGRSGLARQTGRVESMGQDINNQGLFGCSFNTWIGRQLNVNGEGTR